MDPNTGNGSGNATVGTATTWTPISVTVTSGGPMYPGVSATDETVTVKVTNGGKGYQSLTSFTISVANADSSSWSGPTTAFPSEGACSAADFALGANSFAGPYTVNHSVDPTLPDDLAPGAYYTTTVNLHMLDTGVAQDNCQGLTNVPLYVSAI